VDSNVAREFLFCIGLINARTCVTLAIPSFDVAALRYSIFQHCELITSPLSASISKESTQ